MGTLVCALGPHPVGKSRTWKYQEYVGFYLGRGSNPYPTSSTNLVHLPHPTILPNFPMSIVSNSLNSITFNDSDTYFGSLFYSVLPSFLNVFFFSFLKISSQPSILGIKLFIPILKPSKFPTKKISTIFHVQWTVLKIHRLEVQGFCYFCEDILEK